MIQVWHYRDGVTRTPAFPEDYDLVATVDSDGLEYVVERTQHEWTLHPDVHMQDGRTECRPTQVGDVLVSACGTACRVGPFGFGEVTDNRGSVPSEAVTESVAEAPNGAGHLPWFPLAVALSHALHDDGRPHHSTPAR